TLLLLSAGALPLAWSLVLKEYQRERLLTLLNPQPDLLGLGYHSWQSKIAIGSGGLWGKGLLAGTQSRLSFLPERHTDFIFAVLAEELGFAGVVLLVGLFGCLLVHGFTIAYRSRDRLGALIATGVVAMLAVQIFLNIGMTIGLVPIIGLPLPLMSYGGSFLVMTFFFLTLFVNFHIRRFYFGGGAAYGRRAAIRRNRAQHPDTSSRARVVNFSKADYNASRFSGLRPILGGSCC